MRFRSQIVALALLGTMLFAVTACNLQERSPSGANANGTDLVQAERATPTTTTNVSDAVAPQSPFEFQQKALLLSRPFTMVVQESDDPEFPSGLRADGTAVIKTTLQQRGLHYGSIAFGLMPEWHYANALEFSLSDGNLTVSALYDAVSTSLNAHPCGDSWDEAVSSDVQGTGTRTEITIWMSINRQIEHLHANGCGAPVEGTYHRVVKFVIKL